LFQIKLRAGIGRGRSCASILVVPRRKMTLVRALHGGQPWPEFELHGWSWESLPERGERGKGRGRGGRGCGAPGGGRREAQPGLLRAVSLFVMLVVREGRKQEGEEMRRERKEKKKGWKKRKGKREKFKLGNFQKK
jgi:hypothetical protein